jgi:hypothetical protein
MSPLHPTQLNELGRIIYEERLQEAELSRRLAAMNPVNGRSWFSNLSSLFKSKTEKLGQPIYSPVSEGK